MSLDSRGALGCILVSLDRRVVERIEECVGNYTVECKFRSVSDKFEWAFSSVYGPNSDVDSRLLWEELARLISW